MKNLFVTASALAAVTIMTPTVALAGKDKAAKAAPAAATSAPEMAQDAPMTDAAATPAAPSAAGPAEAPATPAAPADTATAPSDPATILRNEFPTFDADKSGELSNAEFTTWMVALRKNSPGEPLTPEQQTAWITQSFAQADTSKNGTVNLDELTKFLVKA